ncbi:type III secretion system (T3SS) inner membrane Yop/YscD-like protein [Knoellia remsis]|uniref:Type III secretion system (T3SS) inner membrane Yop/YscD-like protein n=1 Tax=Knoellia remsis TaxID=407159 RepID=A0A2T0UFL9_9MICO|nr:FHA domain-containing protein [Knoellia remsis]PRY56617.1 type III secretion system (T3SS) inner membrane Yop/YscD-like protein [Knoellia remsis]
MSDQGRETPEREPESSTTMRFQAVEGLEQSDVVHESEHVLTRADQATVDALRPGTALLVVLRGPNTGARFLLDDDLVSSGRHPESDIFLDDVTVSRSHATFERTGGQFVVKDVGSLNGTYVNRERIDEATLQTGDEVQIGKYRLVFYAAKQA